MTTYQQTSINWDAVRSGTIQERFEEFHHKNPEVYYELVTLARSAKVRGHQRVGIDQLFAVLRWNRLMRTSSRDGWKLNNSFRSRYARLIAEREPDLAGIFETRELRAT